jgi:hypothetical protein
MAFSHGQNLSYTGGNVRNTYVSVSQPNVILIDSTESRNGPYPTKILSFGLYELVVRITDVVNKSSSFKSGISSLKEMRTTLRFIFLNLFQTSLFSNIPK